MKHATRRLKFGIRDLLWLALVVALFLGWWVERSHDRKRAELIYAEQKRRYFAEMQANAAETRRKFTEYLAESQKRHSDRAATLAEQVTELRRKGDERIFDLFLARVR